MTFWHDLLRQTPQTPFADWVAEKRDEGERLHRVARREWIKGGAMPAPVYGRTEG